MSPLTAPVVCRATSGAQSPSAGGMIVLHQTTTPAKASAKPPSARQRKREKSAIIVAMAAMAAMACRDRPDRVRRRQPEPQRHRAPQADRRDDQDREKNSHDRRYDATDPHGTAPLLRCRPRRPVPVLTPEAPRRKGAGRPARRQRLTRPSLIRLSAVAMRASSRERGDQPRSRFAFSDVAFFDLPSSGTVCRTDESTRASKPDEPVGKFAGRHAPRGLAQARLQRERDLAKGHKIAGDRDETLALGAGVCHGAQVQVGDVAHVHDPESDPRKRRESAVQQPLDETDRCRGVRA